MNVLLKHRHFVAYHAEVINQISTEYNRVTTILTQFNYNDSSAMIKVH